MDFLAFIFWSSVILLVYIYVGYPVCCAVLAQVLCRPDRFEALVEAPRVSVVIAAYREAVHIEETVRNKLALDWPADRLEVVVVSDGSDDGTDAIVAGIDDPRVRLIRQEPRAGKTSALNLALESVTGEIVVFSDANSIYAADALGPLLAPFADPEVGYVTGRMVYRAPDGSATGEACSTYMRYENLLRSFETKLGSIVGVDGGIDACRRDLYSRMRADQLPDFVLPLTVREHGHRVVFAPGALLYEDALADAASEFSMRVRVALRAWHALKDKSLLLNPGRYGIFSWQLFSHKHLRYLGGFFQVAALAANVPLALGSVFWMWMLGAQTIFYLLALAGHLGSGQAVPKPAALAHYLCLVNWASLVALVRFLRGQRQVMWQPRT